MSIYAIKAEWADQTEFVFYTKDKDVTKNRATARSIHKRVKLTSCKCIGVVVYYHVKYTDGKEVLFYCLSRYKNNYREWHRPNGEKVIFLKEISVKKLEKLAVKINSALKKMDTTIDISEKPKLKRRPITRKPLKIKRRRLT